MKKIIFLISLLLIVILACSNNNKVRIHLDNNTVLPGETITARLYVNHSDTIAPAFYILRGFDTAQLAIDIDDHNCGVFKAAFKTSGEKEINGFVKFVDKQDRMQALNFAFKFEVAIIPSTIPELTK